MHHLPKVRRAVGAAVPASAGDAAVRLGRAIDARRADIEARWLDRVQRDVVQTPGIELTQLRDGVPDYLEGIVTMLVEPAWGNPLLELPNVVATPHVAGISLGSQAEMLRMACRSVVQRLRGERPEGLVNPAVLARGWGMGAGERPSP